MQQRGIIDKQKEERMVVMAKFRLTEELADTIRELRIQNKIQSKDMAVALNRSASFVSKIENGSIKTITEEEFDTILEMIFPGSASPQDRVDKLVEFQIKRYGLESSEDEAWFYNLDTVYRLIPIPQKLVEEINGIITETGISIDNLVSRINANEDISEDERNNVDLPYNEWVESKDSDVKLIIRMKISKEEVEAILSGKQQACNFVTMQAIVHYLFKAKMFSCKNQLADEDIIKIHKAWLELLDKHKFYTLSRKERLLSQTRTKNEAKHILNDFDIENQETINNMLRLIKMASDMDVLTTNKSLKRFVDNMEWDFNLMIRIIGFDFASIGDCSFSNKIQMLHDIRDVMIKYRDMPEEEKKKDIYGDF